MRLPGLAVPARSRLTSLRVMEWSARNLSKRSSGQGIWLMRGGQRKSRTMVNADRAATSTALKIVAASGFLN
jgi:hypothetical protein